MKIRSSKDVEKLDQKIKEELGIEVSKYRNQEVVESFVELLIFPEYVISWVIRPFIISIFVFIIGFFVIDLAHIEYLIYGIIGLLLFIITGVLLGFFFLTWRMKKDIWGIIEYSLEIMKSAVNDLNHISLQTTKENRKDVLGLLFKGIIHIVTIPLLSKAISEQVPFIGGIVNRFVKKILILVSDRLKFDEENLRQELLKGEESNAIQLYSNSITSVSNGLEKVIDIIFSVAQFPLKLSLGILLFFLILFIYLIN